MELPVDRSDALRRRIATACVVLMAVVVVASAFLRHHGASAALQAAWAGELAQARMAHRVAATLVLLGALALTWLGVRRGDRLAPALLALALLLAAVGWAGGASRAPGVVVVNVLGGFAMLALCARLAGADGGSGLGALALGLLALLLLQVALGAAAGAASAARVETVPAQAPLVLAALHRLAGMLLAIALGVTGVWAMHRLQRRSGAAIALLATGLMLLGALAAGADAAPAPLLLVAHNALAAAAAALLARLY